MKAKAAVVAAYKQPLEVREFEVRDPEPGAIVVRIDRATICGTDHHVQQGLLQPVSKTPSVLGHEMVGIVEKLGAGRTVDVAGSTVSAGWMPPARAVACMMVRSAQLADDAQWLGTPSGTFTTWHCGST